MSLQRRPGRPLMLALLAALAVVPGLDACGGGGDEAGTQEPLSASGPNAVTIAQPANTEGRLLASNCFQCHGTLGNGGFEEIRGKSADELLEFQRKPAAGDIMAAHAQGYTPEQLRKIAAYLKQ